ncbi:MAG: hypothetical protein WB975_07325, partial [Nitrososphaeraceae archaeon]
HISQNTTPVVGSSCYGVTDLYSYPDSDSLRILSARMGFPHLAHGILSTFSIVFQILLIQDLHTRTLMVPLGVSLTNLNVRTLAT